MASVQQQKQTHSDVNAEEKPKKLKPCCACPETREPRDKWSDILVVCYIVSSRLCINFFWERASMQGLL